MLTRLHYYGLFLVLGVVLGPLRPASAQQDPGEEMMQDLKQLEGDPEGFKTYLETLPRFPAEYSAAAIDGWVVDAKTGQPLADVIIAAHWELTSPVRIGASIGQLMVLETVSDAQGHFDFPAWGPKPRVPTTGILYATDPELLFFKPDYEWEDIQNDHIQAELKTKDTLRTSDWAGKTIKLKKFKWSTEFKGSIEKYAKHLYGFNERLYQIMFQLNIEDCWWKKIPRMLIAMHLENKRLVAQGLSASSYLPHSIEDRERYSKSVVAQCGSIQKFLERYLP